jgi:hypothetical protein
MRKQKIAILVFFCLFAAACSPRDFLTRRLAADLIGGSEAFKAPQQFFLRTGVVSNKDYLSPEYLVIQRRGWITAVNVPCTANISPSPCWDVSLTPIGVETFHDLIPPEAASRQYFPVNTARRQLVTITGISKNENLAEVDFTWKWVPMNEVGAALIAVETFKSTVGFKHYDDGWRLMEGNEPKSSQGLEDALKDAVPAP